MEATSVFPQRRWSTIGRAEQSRRPLMPPSERESNPPSSEGWIHSDQLSKLPPQRLEAREADAFLEYLFSAPARRPARLSVREGIRVARYLRALAGEADAGPTRRVLKQLESAIGHL